MKDFLLELQTEELPPKPLINFATELENNLITELEKNNLEFNKTLKFATPRRLAVLIKDLAEKSKDIKINKKGPNIKAPENAIKGFAKSCGVSIDKLEIINTEKGDYYHYQDMLAGQDTKDIIIELCNNAIKNMHFARPMRWGSGKFSFIRPIHSIIALFGDKVINGKILGINTTNITKGLRFKDTENIVINNASNYQNIIRENQIEVDFDLRKQNIKKQINDIADANNLKIVKNNNLLNEVCALVEKPKAFIGSFDKEFLELPIEVISSSMAEHQKYWTVLDNNNNLVNKFIAVANNAPKDLSFVVEGNEKVVRPRLADGMFFYNQDKKTTLESKVEKLKTVAFMQDLGTMFDKTQRIITISKILAKLISADENLCARSALLAKADLTTAMVTEFPSLQGVMGGYYASFDGEDKKTIEAIKMHYHPRFAGDIIPTEKESIAIAFADKIDTICGVFLIGKNPTGSKDPFSLRRLALGLMRIIIENEININIKEIIINSLELYQKKYNPDLIENIHNFIIHRLKNYYDELDIKTNTLNAALIKNNNPFDLHLRVLALNNFMLSANADNLILINKRIANILKDNEFKKLDKLSLEMDIENELYKKIKQIKTADYKVLINNLISIKPVLDEFFDKVMVNDSDYNKKLNRLNLLMMVRQLFLAIGDFAILK